MGALKQQFIEVKQGHRIVVLLPIDDYNKMLEQLEKMDDIRAYDAAKASDDDVIPFDQAIKEIETKRNDLLTLYPSQGPETACKAASK